MASRPSETDRLAREIYMFTVLGAAAFIAAVAVYVLS